MIDEWGAGRPFETTASTCRLAGGRARTQVLTLADSQRHSDRGRNVRVPYSTTCRQLDSVTGTVNALIRRLVLLAAKPVRPHPFGTAHPRQ
jgi:hypothetical protein